MVRASCPHKVYLTQAELAVNYRPVPTPPAGKVCREYLVMYHLSPNLDTIYKLNTTLT